MTTVATFQIQPPRTTQTVAADGASHPLTFSNGSYPLNGGVFLITFTGVGTAFVKVSQAGGGASTLDTPVSPGTPMAVPIPNFGGPGDIIVDVNSINTPSGTIYVTPGILS